MCRVRTLCASSVPSLLFELNIYVSLFPGHTVFSDISNTLLIFCETQDLLQNFACLRKTIHVPQCFSNQVLGSNPRQVYSESC